jgi:hypothetical protein
VTAWGVTTARGCIVYCGRCAEHVAFHESLRQRGLAQAEADRVTLAVQRHFRRSPLCRRAETFEGRELTACRCPEPVRIPREDGLYCARCEGLLGPSVAPPIVRRRRTRKAGSR